MTFALTPGKLGFKIGEVLVGLSSGTTNTPDTMGEKLNSAGGAADPWDDSRALTVTKFMGLK